MLQVKNSNAGAMNNNGLNFKNKISKAFEGGHSIIANVNLEYDNFKVDSITKQQLNNVVLLSPDYRLSHQQKNMLLTLNPYYQLKRNDWYVQLGLNVAFNGGTMVMMPYYESSKDIIKDYLIFYNGTKGWVQKNSFYNFSKQNPFMGYTQVDNTISENSYMGVKGCDKKSLTYNAKFSHLYYKHLPFYVNADTTQQKYFAINYQHAASTILNFHADMGYNKNDIFMVQGAFDYYYFYSPETKFNWHHPSIVLGINSSYKVNETLSFTAQLNAWNGVTTKVGHSEVKLKPAIDLSIGATYTVNKYLGVFANINNLLNNKYQRYNGYPVYGVNGMLGVVFKY
jgi:hypothetical protein